MMILQGVGHPVPYLGVLYANDPKKGGYMAYAPALDLTTLFEVIVWGCDRKLYGVVTASRVGAGQTVMYFGRERAAGGNRKPY